MHLRHLVVSVISLSLVACSSDPGPKTTNTEAVTATVGAAGGSLEHPAGAKLVIPAGALDADVVIGIKGEPSPEAGALGATPVGQAFVLTPEGQTFLQPVQLSVPFDAARLPAGVSASSLRLRISPVSANDFASLDTELDATTGALTAATTHFSIVVPAAPTGATPFEFLTTSLPTGVPGQDYLAEIGVNGGTAPHALSVFSGQLPPGLTLASDGVITGTPTGTGTYAFSVRAQDASSPAQKIEKTYAISVSTTGSCTSLQQAGATVTQQREATSAVTPAGGEILSGTYVLTSDVLHTGVGGATGATDRRRKETVRITVNTGGVEVEVAQDDLSGSPRFRRYVGTTSGITLSLTETCPGTASVSVSYTFSDGSLVLIEASGSGTRVQRFSPSGQTGACSDLVNVGPTVDERRIAAMAPTPEGGSAQSGTYVRGEDLIYTGVGGSTVPTGRQRQQTLRVTATSTTGGVIEDHYVLVGSAPDIRRFDFTTSDTTLTVSAVCPTSGTLALGYTMTYDTLNLFEEVTGGTRVTRFKRLLEDGGVPEFPSHDGGTPATDAGTGPAVDTLATGLTDLVDLDITASELFVLGDSKIHRCSIASCQSDLSLVTSAFASSIAVHQDTLFVTTNYQYVSSCDLTAASCTLGTFTDLGASSYPAHLSVANGRLYWLSEAGSTRRIQVCPLSGCTSGYPKIVYDGALLSGVPVSGIAVDATAIYALSYTGGVYRIPLTDAETSVAASAVSLIATDYGSGGLDLDGTTLRWVNAFTGTLEACTVPDCATKTTLLSNLGAPASTRHDATSIYGVHRGTSNGSGGTVSGTATIWKTAR